MAGRDTSPVVVCGPSGSSLIGIARSVETRGRSTGSSVSGPRSLTPPPLTPIVPGALSAHSEDVNGHRHAIVLAGGRGQRLWPRTRDLPKALVPVGGHSILEIILRQSSL
ncbi:MAG: hypothetical protein E6J41_09080 [Chloroflexi bacterium]|nr:MAG: hypothetical protein E6J41_09080 [Chloroflexota bacterium]